MGHILGGTGQDDFRMVLQDGFSPYRAMSWTRCCHSILYVLSPYGGGIIQSGSELRAKTDSDGTPNDEGPPGLPGWPRGLDDRGLHIHHRITVGASSAGGSLPPADVATAHILPCFTIAPSRVSFSRTR